MISYLALEVLQTTLMTNQLGSGPNFRVSQSFLEQSHYIQREPCYHNSNLTEQLRAYDSEPN
jgi:hypothetical protein